jgi:DNA-binding NtrC family response regulator
MAVQRTVLVVDLNPTDRAKTVRLLEAAGYLVTATGNFNEAKHLIAQAAPDLLVTDLRLGSYNGLHLVLRSKTDHPGMASLVTSRFDDPVLQAEAERQKAAFLVRPIADEAFLDAIAQTLGSVSAADATP